MSAKRRAGRESGRGGLSLSAILLSLLLAATAAGTARAENPAAATGPLPRPADAPRPADPPGAADLFAMPRIAERMRTALGLAASGALVPAAGILDDLARDHPGLGLIAAQRAAIAMLAGDTRTALDHLEAAAAAGLPDLKRLLADPVFDPLRSGSAAGRLEALEARAASREAPAPEPEPVVAGIARISGHNTRWNPAAERLEPLFLIPDPAPAAEIMPARPGRDPARDLLRDHWAAGRAAGLHGVFYDNRDRGHSPLGRDLFPQLVHVAYSPAAREAGIDYGLNDSLLLPGIAFGNSSTALTAGPTWRSLPRLALTRPDGTGPMRLWQNWAANHLYIHPAHHDFGHDHGDLFPANTPYLLVSRGSSGSDRPFLEAVAMILAALPPETRARMAAEGLVVPSVQMIFRRSLQDIRSREAYLSGAAHPPVFDAARINLARMVSLAQSITPDAIPAEARIRVEAETRFRAGEDFFGEGLSEQLFDTPSAIARIWRARAGRRVMTLSAAESRDANGRPLAFEWRLLQGDPARVRIEPLDDGLRARITIDWHDPFPVSANDPQKTARVDIGLFAHNGVHDSAPAILSWYFPPHEARRHETGPDGAPRLVSLDYREGEAVYADPFLSPRGDWRDEFRYDAAGRLAGFTRHRDGIAEEHTASGARILVPEGEGRPGRAEAIEHVLVRDSRGALRLEALPTGRIVEYGP